MERDEKKQTPGTGVIIGLILLAFLFDFLGFVFSMIGIASVGIIEGASGILSFVPVLGWIVAAGASAVGIPIATTFILFTNAIISFIAWCSFTKVFYSSGSPYMKSRCFRLTGATFGAEFILGILPGWTACALYSIFRAKVFDAKLHEKRLSALPVRGRSRHLIQPAEQPAV